MDPDQLASQKPSDLDLHCFSKLDITRFSMLVVSFAGTLASSEDPDEMPHYAAFHQGLHCLLRQNQSSERKKYNIFCKL